MHPLKYLLRIYFEHNCNNTLHELIFRAMTRPSVSRSTSMKKKRYIRLNKHLQPLGQKANEYQWISIDQNLDIKQRPSGHERFQLTRI